MIAGGSITVPVHEDITYENFYHGFTAGVLTGMEGYMVRSNREGGDGRSDLFIRPKDHEKTAYVVEFKIAKTKAQMQEKAEEAIAQIKKMKYENELINDGYDYTKRYGIAFFKKLCLVVSG